MSNKIQIKRSTANATVTGLSNGELAFTQASNTLWIGLPDGSGTAAIAGVRNPGTLTANQALVANSTSGIDKVIVANLVPQQIYANGSLGTTDYVLVSGGVDSNVRWADVKAIGGVNVASEYVWTNTHTFQAAVTANTVNAVSYSVGTNFIANSTQVTIGSGVGLSANGGLGSAGQVLMSNGSSVYWATDTGDISAVTAGDGLTGGGSSGDVTLDVGAGNGIEVNASSVAVKAGDGVASNSTGVHVVAGNSGVISNTTGVFVNAATFSIATSQLSGDVALGTQTSGDYVATITAGNGISGSSTGEGGTPTIAVVANNGIVANSSGVFAKAANGISVTSDGINVNPGSTLTVNSSGAHVNSTLSITDLTLAGNLTINGTLTTVDTNNLVVNDSIIELARGNAADSIDIGWYGRYNDGSDRYTGLIWHTATDVYELFANTTAAPTTTLNTSGTGYALATLHAFLDAGAFKANSTSVGITANSTVAVGIVANTLSLSTALAGTSGGTGWATVTNQDLLVGNTSNGYDKLSLGTSGLVLQSNGSALVYDSLDGGTF